MQYERSASVNISEQEKTFRALISNDPALSYFLETGTMQPNAKFAEEVIYSDPAFLAFISPYFHEVYVNAITSAFDLEDTNLMGDINMNAILLDDAHRKQALDDILIYLEQRKAALELFHATLHMQGPINIFILAEHTSIDTIYNLNYLPAEFQEFRSDYAQVIMKVINSLANWYQSAAMTMITDLRELSVDMQTANDVEALYTLLNGNRRPDAIESGYGNSGYSGDPGKNTREILTFVVLMILVIIFTIIEMSSPDYKGSHGGGYHYHRSSRSSSHSHH
ncbi:hypothetical protein L3C95_16745 [Chitinophaga filiformis]|uniref:hypothetical protein n=1 Tax=Chitinophaga filiformis TaxID=104663 RepID=UPI001F2F6198|nr:hypothetical protein [Chitinophaga filiformis]MCF6404547.1 hypothetical protein [Chitinophaga filiformis]